MPSKNTSGSPSQNSTARRHTSFDHTDGDEHCDQSKHREERSGGKSRSVHRPAPHQHTTRKANSRVNLRLQASHGVPLRHLQTTIQCIYQMAAERGRHAIRGQEYRTQSRGLEVGQRRQTRHRHATKPPQPARHPPTNNPKTSEQHRQYTNVYKENAALQQRSRPHTSGVAAVQPGCGPRPVVVDVSTRRSEQSRHTAPAAPCLHPRTCPGR